MTTLPNRSSSPWGNIFPFSSLGPPEVDSPQEAFCWGSSMTNLNLHRTPRSSKVYILQSMADTYGLAPVIVMSARIAQHFPYLDPLHLDCLISSCVRFPCLWKETWKGWVLTPTSLPSFTQGHLKWKWTSHFGGGVPAADWAACRTRRLPCSQELTVANCALRHLSWSLSYQPVLLWRSDLNVMCLKPRCILQCLEHCNPRNCTSSWLFLPRNEREKTPF